MRPERCVHTSEQIVARRRAALGHRSRFGDKGSCVRAPTNCERILDLRMVLQARLAQSAKRKALNLVVVGSSPTVGAIVALVWRWAVRVGIPVTPRCKWRGALLALAFGCAAEVSGVQKSKTLSRYLPFLAFVKQDRGSKVHVGSRRPIAHPHRQHT